MKNIMKNALMGSLLLFGGILMFFSCQKEEITSTSQQNSVATAKTTTGGGGTSCTVSCFWGTATANCPGGGATCYCDWGSPVTSCGGGSTVAGSFNHAGVQDFEQFVVQNQLDPILVQVVHELEQAFNSGEWTFYLQAQENYVNTIMAQPQEQQNMIDSWLASQN